MIGLKFLRHRNRFLARVRRRYFSAETSDSRNTSAFAGYISCYSHVALASAEPAPLIAAITRNFVVMKIRSVKKKSSARYGSVRRNERQINVDDGTSETAN